MYPSTSEYTQEKFGALPGGTGMKRILLSAMLIAGIWGASVVAEEPVQTSKPVAFLGIDLYDLLSHQLRDPIVYWRKMRPQDFVNAPTLWQILV
jgi:hypothetical protein